MKLKRIDKWDLNDINTILSYISDHEETNYKERLKNLSALTGSEYYQKLTADAMLQSKKYVKTINYGPWNRSINVCVFRSSDKVAEVSIFIDEDKEECYYVARIRLSCDNGDGKWFSNDNFDTLYRNAWGKELSLDHSLRFAINIEDHPPKTNSSEQNINILSVDFVANKFLEHASVNDIQYLLDCTNVIFDVPASKLTSIAKECIETDDYTFQKCFEWLCDRDII